MTASEQNLPRIFFDPSEGPDSVRYALWLPQSLIDLDRIGAEPNDGMRIVIYAADGREMEATLEFDRCCDGWTARPVEPTPACAIGSPVKSNGVPLTSVHAAVSRASPVSEVSHKTNNSAPALSTRDSYSKRSALPRKPAPRSVWPAHGRGLTKAQ